MFRKEHLKRLSWWRMLLFVLVLLLIAAGTSLFFGRPSNEGVTAISRFDNYVRSNRIKEARSIYYEEFVGDIELQTQAEESILLALEEIQESYANRRISYETADSSIRALEQSGIFIPSKRIEEAYVVIDEINQSQQHYISGRTAYTEGNYLASINAFTQINPAHSWYDLSRESLERSLTAYRNEVIDSAEALSAAGEHLASVRMLEAALVQMPQDQALVDAYGRMLSQVDDRYRQDILQLARAAADAGDSIYSFRILQSAISYLETMSDWDPADLNGHALQQANLQTDIRVLTAEAARMQGVIETNIVSDIDEYIASASYVDALGRLSDALELLGDSSVLLDMQSELQASMFYELDRYLDADEDLLAIDPGLSLLADWRANFGSNVLELFPVPPAFSANTFEIWWLLPGVNRFSANLMIETDVTWFEANGLTADGLMLRVTVESGDQGNFYELSYNEADIAVDMDIDRDEIFSVTTELFYEGDALPDEILEALEASNAVRLFLANGRFYNDGNFDAVGDYQTYLSEIDSRETPAEGNWLDIVNFTLMPAVTSEEPGTDIGEEPGEDPDNGDLVETPGEGSETEVGLEPLQVARVVDLEDRRYNDSYLISSDVRETIRFSTQRPFTRLAVSVAWLNAERLQSAMLAEIFTDGGAEILALNAAVPQVDILVKSGERPLLRIPLDAGNLSEQLEISLPFAVSDLTITTITREITDRAWAFILDMEVAP